jgi:vacuolar-type H+-ATPase subunit I/STV1
MKTWWDAELERLNLSAYNWNSKGVIEVFERCKAQHEKEIKVLQDESCVNMIKRETELTQKHKKEMQELKDNDCRIMQEQINELVLKHKACCKNSFDAREQTLKVCEEYEKLKKEMK